jgi:multiple sugar transport system substrate-binding protein
MSQPVTWDRLIEVARTRDTQLAVQGRRAESLTVWINALIESAGGSIITDPSPDAPENVGLGLTSDAAVRAAEVMKTIAADGLGGPALSTAGEDENAVAFENGDAAFMVNWPFVWPRALSGVENGTLDASVPADYGWALYPRTVAGRDAAPPYGGINLGVGAFSRHPDLSRAARAPAAAAGEPVRRPAPAGRHGPGHRPPGRRVPL